MHQVAPPWEARVRWDCTSARRLAKRVASGLVLTQADLDASLDLYRRGFLALEPYIASPPVPIDWWSDAFVASTDSGIVDAWTSGRVLTGIPAVDSVLVAAFVDGLSYKYAGPDGAVFEISSSRIMVPRAIAAAFASVPGVTMRAEPFIPNQQFSEVVVEPHPELADQTYLVFRIGWGDCMVACDGQHFWRVLVTSTSSRLITAWGDPIPPDVLDRWSIPNPDR